MKRFLQLIIVSVVVGLICLFVSHKYTAKDHSKLAKNLRL